VFEDGIAILRSGLFKWTEGNPSELHLCSLQACVSSNARPEESWELAKGEDGSSC
jgi:hypothetical protein